MSKRWARKYLVPVGRAEFQPCITLPPRGGAPDDVLCVICAKAFLPSTRHHRNMRSVNAHDMVSSDWLTLHRNGIPVDPEVWLFSLDPASGGTLLLTSCSRLATASARVRIGISGQRLSSVSGELGSKLIRLL